jgi:hypothetical protein
MAIFEGVLFLILGIGLMVVDYQSLARGWLPCGSRWFAGPLRFRRDEQPLQYWATFFLYALMGTALTIFALRLLLGDATPLPLQ